MAKYSLVMTLTPRREAGCITLLLGSVAVSSSVCQWSAYLLIVEQLKWVWSRGVDLIVVVFSWILNMLDFLIFAAVVVLCLIVSIIYLYPVRMWRLALCLFTLLCCVFVLVACSLVDTVLRRRDTRRQSNHCLY